MGSLRGARFSRDLCGVVGVPATRAVAVLVRARRETMDETSEIFILESECEAVEGLEELNGDQLRGSREAFYTVL